MRLRGTPASAAATSAGALARSPSQRSVTDWLRTDNVRPARAAAVNACSIIQKTPSARTPSNYSGEITSSSEPATDDADRGQYRLGAPRRPAHSYVPDGRPERGAGCGVKSRRRGAAYGRTAARRYGRSPVFETTALYYRSEAPIGNNGSRSVLGR